MNKRIELIISWITAPFFLLDQKEAQVLAIIDRGTMKNPDTGYALTIASCKKDGSYRTATSVFK